MDYEQLRKIIDDKLATDPEFRTLVKRINSGRANFIDTSRYSQILSQTIGKELSKSIESITDKEAITQQLLKDSYNEINDVCARVQEMIDSDAGVHINPQQASFPKERVESFSHSLVDLTVDSDVIRRRARAGSETITKSFHDSYIKKNAQFRNDAGFNCYIVREGRSCCKWCADVAGKYKFGEQPDGIFRRHDNCNCTIIYDGQTMRGKFNSDGTRSKTWEEIPNAEADFSPTVLSEAEAEKIEQRNLGNFRGLYIDKSAEKDIIKIEDCNKKIKESKQNEHREGHKRWIEESLKNIEKGNNPNSFIYNGVNEQELVDAHSGHGVIYYRKGNPYPLEYVSTSKPMGETFERNLNSYVPSKRLCIVYSKKGTHIFPVTERRKEDE